MSSEQVNDERRDEMGEQTSGPSIGDLYELIHNALWQHEYNVDGQRDALVVQAERRTFVVSVVDVTHARASTNE